MKVYTATKRCYSMANSIHAADSPEMKVIYYMGRVHQATREQIEENTGVDSGTVIRLSLGRNPILRVSR